jgi:hypothetical protein
VQLKPTLWFEKTAKKEYQIICMEEANGYLTLPMERIHCSVANQFHILLHYQHKKELKEYIEGKK